MTLTLPAPDATTASCAQCGEALTSDPRFVRWCQACGWNAYPAAKQATGRADRFQRRFNREAEERLYRRVTGGGRSRSSDLATAATYVLAGLVHAATLAVAVGGVLAVLSAGWPLRVVGVALLGFAWMLRPRLGSLRRLVRRRRVVERASAPALYGLCDRIAAELGTDAPHTILVDGRHNASYARVGPRRRVVLTIGLPLWEVLEPAERVALLGHELGHGAAGDTRRGLWVGGALGSLEEWYALFHPGHRRTRSRRGSPSAGGGLAVAGEMVANVVLAVFAEVTLRVHHLLVRLTAFAGRRAEYRADALAARVAGRAGAEGLLRALTLGSSVEQVRQRRRPGGRQPRRGEAAPAPAPRADFLTELREYVRSIPESERARRLRVCELDDSAVDSTHPPTHRRLQHVTALPAAEPVLTLTDEESATVRDELATVRRQVAAGLG